MVDVSDKPITARRAVAEAEVTMDQETLSLIIDGGSAKGDVLTVAELAGVMGAKRTSELIPLCHPIPLTDLVVEIRPDRARSLLTIRATAATVAQTGVEMEALTGAAVAALTVYDMIKGVDRGAEIRDLRVTEKSGGKSGSGIVRCPRRHPRRCRDPDRRAASVVRGAPAEPWGRSGPRRSC